MDAVKTAGRMTEALETLERARGHLMSFHQLVGSADLALDDVVAGLRENGHEDLARRVETELLGRNVIPDRWTFEIVEEFDDGYWSVFRDSEKAVRDALTGGRRHVYEADMKAQRQTPRSG